MPFYDAAVVFLDLCAGAVFSAGPVDTRTDAVNKSPDFMSPPPHRHGTTRSRMTLKRETLLHQI